MESVVLLLTLVVAGAPRASHVGTDLDPGWRMGLQLARDQGMRFGHDLMWTYGPLGVLDQPLLLDPVVVAASVALGLLATGWLWWEVRSTFVGLSLLVAAPLGALAAWLAHGSWGLAGCVLVAMMVRTVALLDGRLDDPHTPWIFAVLTGLLVLVAFSTAPYAGFLTLVVLVRRGRLMDWPKAGVAGLATVLVGWLGTGQQLGDLAPWIRGSLELTGGYGSAMSLDNPVESLYLTLLLSGGALLIWATLTDRRTSDQPGRGHSSRKDRVLTVLMVVVTLWYAVRLGMTRADIYHLYRAAILGGLLLLVFDAGWARTATPMVKARQVVVWTLAGLLLHLGSAAPDRSEGLSPWAQAFSMMGEQSRARLISEDRATAVSRDPDGVAAAMAEVIGERPVHMDPWEITLPWAWGVQWRPVPVMQPYAAYTPELDLLNAESLAADHERLVVREIRSLPDLNQLWTSPLYNVELVCRFQVVGVVASWSVLEHGEDRCSEPRVVGNVRAVAGEPVEIPVVEADQLLTVSIRPADEGFVAGLGAALLTGADRVRVEIGENGYEVPPVMADGPLIMRLPEGVWSNADPALLAPTLVLDVDADVEFSVRDVAPPPASADPGSATPGADEDRP